jgi:hypothetical protein
MEKNLLRRATAFVYTLMAGCLIAGAGTIPDQSQGPRIVNLYNFIRNSDFRLGNSEDVLFDCTRHQIELLKRVKLPATWALQYDALINPRYPQLLKAELSTNDEIAAWWEIPRPLAEKAGLLWRGRHDWDPAANVGFSPGYTPDERRKLVDVYMADFKKTFGAYPKTVGSWYIDEITLAYLAEKYGIVASCNCKDQIGTDFYTLWGGYWNQAYYPSRLNAYMPAQTRSGQINVPIFRMLGSDPIYQHGVTPGMFTLEPVYPDAGGSSEWVNWFMGNFIRQPPLAFAYVQTGQENSFGWEAMKNGLTEQAESLASLAQSGRIRVETLAQSGQWFRRHFSVTPPTAVVALDDWKHQGRKTIWYDSRYYRLNLLWQDGLCFIRDLHCFDQSLVSSTHDTALTATSLSYETLPIMDWARWSGPANSGIGMWPVLLSSNDLAAPMIPEGEPSVKEAGAKALEIGQPIQGGGNLSIICEEGKIVCTAIDGRGQPLAWGWKLAGGAKQSAVVQSVSADAISYLFNGIRYQLRLPRHSGICRRFSDGSIEIATAHSGTIVLVLDRAGN